MRALTKIALTVAFALLGPASVAAQAFDRSAWLADFEEVKAAITDRSPNLDWAVERGLDLPALERRARQRLADANDDYAARFALERFVQGFGDEHMDLTWPSPPRPAPSGPAAAPSICGRLNYPDRPDTRAIASALPGYASVAPADAYITAGVVRAGDRTIGAMRIPLFAPNPLVCAQALQAMGLSPGAPCDEPCIGAVSRRTDAVLLAEIATRVRALKAAGAQALLVDVAGNGGGSDIAIAIARMLAGADVRTPSIALVKTPSRVRDLEEDLSSLRAGVAGADAKAKVFAAPMLAALASARAEAETTCNREAVWRNEPVTCSKLLRGPFFAGGLTPGEIPDEFRSEPWAELVSATARFPKPERVWSGPLFILVDGDSASSTELFTAMLQDAGRAVVVGSPSSGAGCGWNMPREPVSLRHSGGRLVLPNCARFRADGANEVDGIQPDVLVGFRTYDSTRQRAARLAAALGRLR